LSGGPPDSPCWPWDPSPSGRTASPSPRGPPWGLSRGSCTSLGLGVGCWPGWVTGPRSTGFSGCGRTGCCPTGFGGPFGEPCKGPCGCSRGTCVGLWSEETCLPGGTAGFPRPTGAPRSAGGRGASRDTGGRGSALGAPAGSGAAGLGRAGRTAGRDAGPPFAGSPRTGRRSARGVSGLDGATGALSGPWPTDRWGVAGPAVSGTLADCCARDALSAHNIRPSATRTQIAARTHRFRTATLPTPLLPSAE
jgi:hypothetical protein